ncbi:MAG: hypothetical protein WC723_02200 [Candidatus Omnitrophota bacterium]
MSIKRKYSYELFFIPFVVFFIISLLVGLVILQNIHYWGQMDWDQFTFWNATPRESILKYHQFPLWNNYSNGGNISLAHPHSLFLSPFYILVFIFGPVIGLKLEFILHLFIGMFGIFLLFRHILPCRYSAYLPPLVYMLSSVFTLHFAEGHGEWLAMAFIPWLFLFYFLSFKRFKYVIGCIFSLSLMLFGSGVHIFSIAIILFLSYCFLLSLRQRSLAPLKTMAVIFVGTFLLCSIKLIPALEFIKDNPRKAFASGEFIPISFLPDIFLSRGQAQLYQKTKLAYPERSVIIADKEFPVGWHEYGAYIGIVPLILGIAGLIFYFKQYWPLWLMGILSLWISLGKSAYYNLWGLLTKLPLYDSFHAPSRFILGFVFCAAIFSGLGLSKLEDICEKKKLRYLIIILIGALFYDFFLVNYPLWKQTFTIRPPEIKRNLEFKQRYRDFNLFPGESRSSMYAAFLNNSGVINSYEVVGIKKGKVRIYNDQDYKGEAYLLNNNGQVAMSRFSPNSIEINVNILMPDRVVINQNFYKGWKIKGVKSEVQPYDGLISAELPAGRYRIVFYYLPSAFIIGSLLSAASVFILIVYLFV